MNSRPVKWTFSILLFALVGLIIVAHSLTTGELSISLFDMPDILSGSEETIQYTILKNIRLPRILLGIVVGGALSLAGVLLQGIFKNPLVEPYTLGISGGAALGVAIIIVMGLHHIIGIFMLPLAGFLGAVLTIFLVYTLSIRRGKIRIQGMLLIGVMISFIASSAMMFLMAITTSENIHGIVFWIMGSLNETNTGLIYTITLLTLFSLLTAYLFVQPLNALRLGEEKARHLGINTDVAVKVLFILSSLLTGICVSVAGVIGFVGLIIPHLIRLIVGSDFRILLICSFIAGGSFLVFCDTLARTVIAPNELPIGVITGIIGGLLFIVVLSRSSLKSKLS